MGIDDSLPKLLAHLRKIRAVWLDFLFALAIVGFGMWGVFEWHYGERINLLTEQRDDYKNKLGGASPDQAKARIDALQQKIDELSARVGPEYPITEEQKVRLARVLEDVPTNERFHVTVLWPVITGGRRYADEIQQVFSSVKWDATISGAGGTFGTGISFVLSQEAYDDKTKRPLDAVKLMGFFDQAGIQYNVNPWRNLTVPYAFMVGPP